MQFRRFVLAAAAALCVASVVAPASAADIGTRSGYDYGSPSYVAPFSWTGFYVGGNVGYGFKGQVDASTNAFGTVTDQSVGTGGGAVLGGQLGYNWQFSQRWVLGLEADLQWTGLKGSREDTWCDISTCGFTGTTTTDARLNWFGTVRPRIGWLATERLMVYGTGGFAYGQMTTTTTDHCAFCSYTTTTKQAGVGYALGGGVEWAFADNWSAKAEYLYVSLDGPSTHTDYGGGFTSDSSSKFHTSIARVGLNYRF